RKYVLQRLEVCLAIFKNHFSIVLFAVHFFSIRRVKDIFYIIGFIHFCQSYQGIPDFTDAISEGFLTLEFTFAIYENNFVVKRNNVRNCTE
ncbi:MAG: hypothetical protein LBR68_03425, partial [Lachnoclostridium sp.]|nr:hypothetical protein [Lachnoclostridium sp.]